MGYSNIGSSGGSSSNLYYSEEFTCTNGQTVFTLTLTPITNSQLVLVNGLTSYLGIDYDYTISSNIITFNYGLESTDKIMVNYS